MLILIITVLNFVQAQNIGTFFNQYQPLDDLYNSLRTNNLNIFSSPKRGKDIKQGIYKLFY